MYMVVRLVGQPLGKMTIRFRKRSKGAIYVRVSIGRGNVIEKKTPFSPGVHSLRLKELEVKIEKAFNQAVERGRKIDGEWLEMVMSGDGEATVQAQVDKIISEAHTRPNGKGGVGLSEGRIKHLRVFQKKITAYHGKLPLSEVDLAFSERYRDYLFAKGYSVNYVGKQMNILKTVCRDAEKSGVSVSREVHYIKNLSQRNTNIVVLTPADQRKIMEADLPRESLRNARRWLLLGCQVGQRGTDLLELTSQNLVEKEGVAMLELVQQKTGKMVYVPLTPTAKTLLEDGFPHHIPLQKFNNHLKDIADICGVDKYLTSHVMRRSFATNFYGKVPTSILIGITGHSTEAMFLRYIGKTSLDKALEFAKHFS